MDSGAFRSTSAFLRSFFVAASPPRRRSRSQPAKPARRPAGPVASSGEADTNVTTTIRSITGFAGIRIITAGAKNRSNGSSARPPISIIAAVTITSTTAIITTTIIATASTATATVLGSLRPWVRLLTYLLARPLACPLAHLPAHPSKPACPSARLLPCPQQQIQPNRPNLLLHSCSARCSPWSSVNVRNTSRPACSSSTLCAGVAADCSAATTRTEAPTSSRAADQPQSAVGKCEPGSKSWKPPSRCHRRQAPEPPLGKRVPDPRRFPQAGGAIWAWTLGGGSRTYVCMSPDPLRWGNQGTNELPTAFLQKWSIPSSACSAVTSSRVSRSAVGDLDGSGVIALAIDRRTVPDFSARATRTNIFF